MKKSALVILAAERGLAVYRGDTAATIAARIAAADRAAAERAAAAALPIARLRQFATARRFRRVAIVQLALPMAMPRDWSACAGRIVSRKYDTWIAAGSRGVQG